MLVGPGQCGKTIVLNLLSGLTPPTEGTVEVAGKVVTAPGPERGVVFQSVALFPWLTVIAVHELYNLRTDISESQNVYADYPEVVAQLTELAEQCRQDLGDTYTGTVGANIRPIGQVENAAPLTEYDENHPYIIALYDRSEVG